MCDACVLSEGEEKDCVVTVTKVTGVAEGVDWKICVSLASAVCAAAV